MLSKLNQWKAVFQYFDGIVSRLRRGRAALMIQEATIFSFDEGIRAAAFIA